MDVEDAGVDPYEFLSNPSICTPQYHAKARKNCATNPFCVYGFGDCNKQGIYKNPSILIAELGVDPNEFRRQGLTKRSKTLRPVGLQNLGATCYLNVLIQSLFQNILIRDAVLNFVPSSTVESRKTVMDDVMEALQGAFSHMILSKKNVFSLSHFTSLLGLDAGEQQDPQEFNKLFMGKLEGSKIKVLHEGRKSIAQLLEGKEIYSTVCSKCKTESRRSQAFRELELKVDGLKSVEQGLELYFASEDLSGDNQYFCSKCDCKRDAVRRVEIEEPPPVLTIDLMRYVYDLKTYSKVKLKTSLRFEEKIAFQGEDYRLVSVLYHKGRSAYGGHYVAETLDWANEQWWHCDDTSVLPCASPVRGLPPAKTEGSAVEVMDISQSPVSEKATGKGKAEAKGKGKGKAKSSGNTKGKRGAAKKRKRKVDDEEEESEEEEEEEDARGEDETDNAIEDEGGDDDKRAEGEEAEAEAEAEASPESGRKAKVGRKPTAAAAKAKGAAKSPTKKGVAKKKDGIDLDRARDAYCFSYVKESIFQEAMSADRIAPSEGATQLVALHDEAFEREMTAYTERRKAIEEQIAERKEAYKRVEQSLAVKSAQDPYHFVPAAWLQQWVTGIKAKPAPVSVPAAASSSSSSGSNSDKSKAVSDGTGDGKAAPIIIDLEEEASVQDQEGGEGKVVNVDDGNCEKREEKSGEDGGVQAIDLTTAPAPPGVFADPVRNAPFLCPHSSIDGGGRCFPSIPALQGKLKAISAEAYAQMVVESDLDFASDNYRCSQCFQERSTQTQGLQAMGQSYTDIIDLIEADNAAPPPSAPDDAPKPHMYDIPLRWLSSLKRERDALLSGKRGQVDSTVTGELLCKHKLKDPESRKKTVRMSAASWDAVVRAFPDAVPLLASAPACAQCRQESNDFVGTQHRVKAIRSREMDKSKDLRPLTLASAPRYPEVLDDKAALLAPLSEEALLGKTFFAVDDKWMNVWRAFHSSKTLPTLSQRAGPLANLSLRCEHGLCLLSDQLRLIAEGRPPGEAPVLGPMGDGLPQPELVTETQWNSLVEFYGPEANDKEDEEDSGGDEEGSDEKKEKVDEGEMEVQQVRTPPFAVSVAANAEGRFVWSPAPCVECIQRLKQRHVQENTEYANRALTIAVLGVGESVPNRPAEPEGSPPEGGGEDSKGKSGDSESPSNVQTERRASKRRRKGQTFMITASSSDSLMLIMLKISEKLVSNHEGRQTVYLRGKELVGRDKTMREHGVCCGDLLHVQVEDEKESGYDLGTADSYGHSRVESGFRGSFLSMDNGVKQDDPGLSELRRLCGDMGLSFKDHLLSGAFTNAKGNIEVALSILTS